MAKRKSQKTGPGEVPGDIRRRVIRDFGSAAAEKIYRHLLQRIPPGLPNGTRPRHLRCILFLAQGDQQRLDHYIAVCLQDTRDVMLQAEYETDARSRLVRKRNFDKPFGRA